MQCLPKTPLDFGLPPCTLKFHRGCAFAAVSQELSHNRHRDERHPSGWPRPIDAARVGSTGARRMKQAFVFEWLEYYVATYSTGTGRDFKGTKALGFFTAFCCPDSSKRTLDVHMHMGRLKKREDTFAKNASSRRWLAGGDAELKLTTPVTAQNIHRVNTVPRPCERLVVPRSGALGGVWHSSLHRVSSPSLGVTVFLLTEMTSSTGF